MTTGKDANKKKQGVAALRQRKSLMAESDRLEAERENLMREVCRWTVAVSRLETQTKIAIQELRRRTGASDMESKRKAASQIAKIDAMERKRRDIAIRSASKLLMMDVERQRAESGNLRRDIADARKRLPKLEAQLKLAIRQLGERQGVPDAKIRKRIADQEAFIDFIIGRDAAKVLRGSRKSLPRKVCVDNGRNYRGRAVAKH
jgi:hypothetical protein